MRAGYLVSDATHSRSNQGIFLMRMNPLGCTGISVSEICLGTMTFGEQNTEAQAFQQLDMAFGRGVNFIDTAEMYSFPARTETQGRTEEIIGNWMWARGNRDRVVLATKITGPGPRFEHIRGGNLKLGREQITAAIDLSLKRLKTHYIDLYQTHWPERPANYFGRLDYEHAEGAQWTPIAETLAAMDDEIKAGRIREFGVSNETPWGLMEHMRISETNGLPRAASIQNPYSLLCRTFEIGLSEIAIRENCGLLAYSPLGFGALTGKYMDGNLPEASRYKLYPEYARYFQPRGVTATLKYVALAREHGLDPAQMALAFANSRRFLTSSIIGATTTEQLTANLASVELTLTAEVIAAIERIHAEDPNPAP